MTTRDRVVIAVFMGAIIGVAAFGVWNVASFLHQPQQYYRWCVVIQRTNDHYSGVNYGYVDDVGCVFAGFTNRESAEAALKWAKQISEDPISSLWEKAK